MAVGYRSIFSLRHGQDAMRLTAEQLRSWLALKGYGLVALAPGVHQIARTRPARRDRTASARWLPLAAVPADRVFIRGGMGDDRNSAP